MGLKPTEIIMIVGIVLLLFGASRLPQLGSSLGTAIRNFKKGFSGEDPAKHADAPASPAALGARADVSNASAQVPESAASKVNRNS